MPDLLNLNGRALVDVDGVLSNFRKHVLDTVPGGTQMTVDDVTDYDVFSMLGDPGEEMQKTLLRDPEWWRAIPVNSLANAGIVELRTRVDELFFVTSPWWNCPGWEHARRAWLSDWFDAKNREVIPTSSKHIVNGQWFLDDRPEHVKAWIEEQVKLRPIVRAYLYDAPYNRDASGFYGRFTWARYLEDPEAFHLFPGLPDGHPVVEDAKRRGLGSWRGT